MHASSLHHLKSLLLDGSVQKGPIVEYSQFFAGQDRFVGVGQCCSCRTAVNELRPVEPLH